MGAYRFIYQTFMYRNSTYLLGVAAMAFAFEQVNREIAYNVFTSANQGNLQYQLRKQISDQKAEEGEKATWNFSVHTSIPSPNGDNFELKTGEPRYYTYPGQ